VMNPAMAVAGVVSSWTGTIESARATRRFANITLLPARGRGGAPGIASAVRSADVVWMQHFAGAGRNAPAALMVFDVHERLDASVHCIPGVHLTQERRGFGRTEQAQDAIRLGDAQLALQVVEPILHQTFVVEHETVEKTF